MGHYACDMRPEWYVDPDKKKKGVYRKFYVKRLDGKDAPGKKHSGCDYFVLDLDHDPYAKAALRAYAKACEGNYPILAADLKRKVKEMK